MQEVGKNTNRRVQDKDGLEEVSSLKGLKLKRT